MRKRLALAATGIVLVFAVLSTGAQGASGGRVASGCATETVVFSGKPITLRFVVHNVSCRQAHRLIRTYFHDVASHTCRDHGTACIFIYAGGWDCSVPDPALHSKAFAGCDRAASGRLTASVTVYKLTRKSGRPTFSGTISLAGECVTPLPASGRTCVGQIGRRAHGYAAQLNAVVGSEHPDHDSAVVDVIRRAGKVVQAHEWGVALLPRDVRINRSKVSIEVKHPIGPRGTDGEIDFSFSGRPHFVKSTRCVPKYEVVNGTIKGKVQIRVHDRFFKTITLTRVRARASDLQFGQGCRQEPCPPRQSSLSGATSHAPTSPAVTLSAGKPPHLLAPLAVDVSEPTAGTPFTVINHSLTLGGTRSFLTFKPKLTGATVGTPGGVFSGGLGVRSSGPATTFLEPCKGGHFQVTNRPATVTRGTITARFDSIGKVSVGRNLNGSLDLQSWRRVP